MGMDSCALVKGSDLVAGRKSFVLFCDRVKELEMLSNEECGILFKAIMYYVSSGKVLETDSIPLKMLFSVFRSQLDENGEKYQKKKEANAEYYRKHKDDKKNSADSDYSENSASDTVTDTVTDTITVTGTVTDINNNTTTPPSRDEVAAYCRERMNGIDAAYFCDYYDAIGWRSGNNQITDWKAAVRKWERTERKKGHIFDPSDPMNEGMM